MEENKELSETGMFWGVLFCGRLLVLYIDYFRSFGDFMLWYFFWGYATIT